MKKYILLVLLIAYLFLTHCVYAQESSIVINKEAVADPITIANEYIRKHLEEWRLAPQDIDGMTVNNMYTDQTSGITRIYFLQHHRGIPVYNAILNISITREGKVFFAGNRFVPDLSSKVNTTDPVLSPIDAVKTVATHLGFSHEELQLARKMADSKFVFNKGLLAKEDITAHLSYQPYEGKALLAWDILFAPAGNLDKWSIRVDAVTGYILHEHNWTVYCNQDGNSFSREDNDYHVPVDLFHQDYNTGFTGAQYNVWPAPIENPNDGPRTIVMDPADPIASPFGWHDTNGQPGAEYTITRGNNVYAYQDRDRLGYSSNDEPNGGAQLHFDFPFDPSWEPEQYLDAATVNLFYWTNYMHDFAYRFGFDEAAGNFQKNNYGKGGMGNDALFAVTQSAANAGYSNNATYYHSSEGTSSSIHMMVFNRKKRYLTVNEPASVAGKYETSLPGDGWGAGAYVSDVPVTGEVVIVDDGVEEPFTSDACQDIINGPDLAGKIALIDRGACPFSSKVLKAQNAGAIGVIICSYDDVIFGMAPGQDGANINIPVVGIHAKDVQIIREYAGNGLKVSLVLSGYDSLPTLDSDLDNGIIAHEYGHGIAIRLAGGAYPDCFNNEEQMGEGWADFFALVPFVQPGDSSTMARGCANYAAEEPSRASGSRRYPYSVDMNVSPLTYGDVAPNLEVHAVGEVWTNVLWDMYWAMVEKYGWSADNFNPTSGNHKAIRLVFDGLKNMICSPGFVDGRNAILAADESLYNGENSCLLWEVFARRGLGYSAEQGSPFDGTDQIEAFDIPPACSDKIIIEKSVTDFIQPGDDIEVTITTGNYKNEKATNLIVTDEIPEGTSFKPNSSNLPANVQGNIVSFNLEDLNPTEEKTITYTLESSSSLWSKRRFKDDVPNENNLNWSNYTIGNAAPNVWAISDVFTAHSGNYAWYVKEIPDKSHQVLMLNPEKYSFHVEGEQPVLRFYHRYQTKGGLNGGFVEVREVGTHHWQQVSSEMIRKGYQGIISYRTFISPNVHAFYGNNEDEYQATYVDLSAWAGKDIQIRFRFGTDVNSNDGLGWLIDDIEFMDMHTYNGETCVTSDQGDYECTIAPQRGTIVESKEDPLSATEPLQGIDAKIYPNPANDIITVSLSSDHRQDVTISFMTVDGRQLFAKPLSLFGKDSVNIATNSIPPGLYFVHVSTAEGFFVAKVIIQK